MLDKSVQSINEEQLELQKNLDRIGRDFIGVFYATLKVAAMYEPNNNRYIEQGNQMRAALKKIFDLESDFSVISRGGYMYISEVRLKSDRDSDDAITYFLDHWRDLGLSGFTFSAALDARELDKFVYFISGLEPSEDAEENFQNIASRMNELKIEKITPIKYSFEEDNKVEEDESKQIRGRARKTFFSALAVVQSNATQVKNQNNINIAKTKRVVQGLIDVILQDEAAMLELTTLRNFDDYTYVHSVNVCVLSLMLGFHLGMDRKRLSQLGVGALLHDIGKMKMPLELINKPDAYDDNDWRLMRQHPIFGLKFLFKTRALEETTARAATAIFEHHIGYSGGGYPELPNRRTPSLYARIVSISDSYNAMSAGRIYHQKKILPDEVISNMVKRAGKDFDPLLLKIFINAVGIYPVGTVVTMSNKEIGIVARNNPNDLENPQVKIIGDENGLFEIADVKVIDLSREPGIHITRVLDGEKHNIDNAEYLDIG